MSDQVDTAVQRLLALLEKRAPVQGYPPGIPWPMHLRAYAAYCKKWSPQPALIDLEGRNCRGGFGTEELDGFIPGWRDELHEVTLLKDALANARKTAALLNAPELHDFAKGVVLEAAHQRGRWGTDHDAGKEPEDWLWLLGWLAGKAVRATRDGDRDKALHHCISSAAVLANWHASILGVDTSMRPGIAPPEPA